MNATKKLDDEFVEALLNETKTLCETMVMMVPNSVERLDPLDWSFSSEVVGILGFTGSNGISILGAPKALAEKICANMLCMEDISEIENDDEIADSFGELQNIIIGNLKNTWVKTGNTMHLAIPSVSFGKPVSHVVKKSASMRFAFVLKFDLGDLRLDVHFYDSAPAAQ